MSNLLYDLALFLSFIGLSMQIFLTYTAGQFLQKPLKRIMSAC
jgi:hypothetical protein